MAARVGIQWGVQDHTALGLNYRFVTTGDLEKTRGFSKGHVN